MDASDSSGSGALVTLLREWGWREEGKPASTGGVSEKAIAGGTWGLALPGTQGDCAEPSSEWSHPKGEGAGVFILYPLPIMGCWLLSLTALPA